MARSTKRFAELLQEGIAAIADRTSKPKSVIRDELGYAIGRKGGSAIEYWGYGDGHIPRKQSEVEALARVLVDEGKLDQAWLAAFLDSAGCSNGAEIVADLFPGVPDQSRNNLPLAPTPFVGRDMELADLARLIADPDCRLITLLGPGGSGKTRLATEAARNALTTFADGALFVGRASLSSADLATPAVAASLNLTLDGHITPLAQVLRYLRGQRLLIVLDNFEHLLTSAIQPTPKAEDNPAVALVTGILNQAPDVMMLVTSRERLNIGGEWVYDVGGLKTPTEEGATSTGQSVAGYSLAEESAPTLFVQTARRAQSSFAPTAADLAAIWQICRLVNGMPLAIELAAAWVRMLSCVEIAEEIEEGLGILTTTQRDLSPRHRSMQAVFDHSWRLLSAEEQRVFAACSVFRGGFTREAAVEVAGASLPLLAALADKSLLRRNRQARYEIHELARQFAADRLATAQEVILTRNRHLRFFTHFAEEAEPELMNGQHAIEWLHRLERDHDNLRAALEWALSGGEFVMGLRIVGALWDFWMDRGYTHEGQSQAERYLARPEAATDTYLRARALHTAGVLAFYQGHLAAASAYLRESIALSRQLGGNGKSILMMALIAHGHTLLTLEKLDAGETAARESRHLGRELQNAYAQGHAFLQLAAVARQRGESTNARQHILTSIECFQTSGDRGMYGIALGDYGMLLYAQGDYAAAHAYVTDSLTIFEKVGDTVRRSRALMHLGVIAMAQNDNAQAQAPLTQALQLIRNMGQLRLLTDVLDIMGRLAQRQGDHARSSALLQESLGLAVEMNHTPLIARALEALACLAAAQGRMEEAGRLFGATETHAVAVETQLDPVWHADHKRWVAAARTQLGEEAFSAAWAAGAAMELEQAIDNATNGE